jgi:5-methylcytosine-specific restriction protein A
MWDTDKNGNRHIRGYGREWEKRRAIVLARDNYLCKECLKHNLYTPATEVDHRIPKTKGGTDDLDNLQALCNSCHKIKTANDNSNKIKIDINGIPDDPNHHWNKNTNGGGHLG